MLFASLMLLLFSVVLVDFTGVNCTLCLYYWACIKGGYFMAFVLHFSNYFSVLFTHRETMTINFKEKESPCT